jgi:hypothetical protein
MEIEQDGIVTFANEDNPQTIPYRWAPYRFELKGGGVAYCFSEKSAEKAKALIAAGEL